MNATQIRKATKTTRIFGILAVSTLLGACGGAADEMLTGLDESQITTSISCGDSLNALERKAEPGHGGSLAPATEPGHGGSLTESAESSDATSAKPGHGGSLAPVASPSESEPGHGGSLAPATEPGHGGSLSASVTTIALSSSLECSSYHVEINGVDVDAETVLIEGAGNEAAVQVNEDGTFSFEFNAENLEDLNLTTL